MFSMKATKIDEIFTVDLTLCSKCQIEGEDFFNFCGLLRKQELYHICYFDLLSFDTFFGEEKFSWLPSKNKDSKMADK